MTRYAPLLPPGEAVVAASVVTTCQPQLSEKHDTAQQWFTLAPLSSILSELIFVLFLLLSSLGSGRLLIADLLFTSMIAAEQAAKIE